MDSKRFAFGAGAAWLLMLLALVALPGCGDKEGDIVAPDINVNASSAMYVTSDTATIRVDAEVGAEIEVAVADGLTVSTPVLEGTSAVGDTWSFVISDLQPGSNAIAVTAKDKTGNQQTLFMTVVYNFLAIDRLVTSVEKKTAGYQIMGTVAEAAVPVVTMTASDGTDVPAVTTELDGTFGKRWIATFDMPDTVDSYSMSASYGGETVVYPTLLLPPLVSYDPDGPVENIYPLATITPMVFEINGGASAFTISGTCKPDANLTVLFNGLDQTIASPCAADGLWSSDVTLKPGKNIITLTVTDTATTLSTMAFDAIWYLLP